MVYHMIAPSTHFAPAVQHSYTFYTIRCGSLDIVIQGPEFPANALHIVNKIRELHSQLQISAVADTVDRLSQNSSSGCYPVHLCLFHRVTALVECIREEVGKKTSLCIIHTFNITDQAQGGTISHTSHNSVQTYGFEFIHKWLSSNPVVT